MPDATNLTSYLLITIIDLNVQRLDHCVTGRALLHCCSCWCAGHVGTGWWVPVNLGSQLKVECDGKL